MRVAAAGPSPAWALQAPLAQPIPSELGICSSLGPRHLRCDAYSHLSRLALARKPAPSRGALVCGRVPVHPITGLPHVAGDGQALLGTSTFVGVRFARTSRVLFLSNAELKEG